MKLNIKSLRGGLILSTLATLTLFAGCSTEPPVGPLSPVSGQSARIEALRLHPLSPAIDLLCDTDSGVLTPDIGLVLNVSNSAAMYLPGSVSGSTPVSFSVCDLDTTGLNLAPKTATFGDDPDQRFRFPIEVSVALEDAGLAAADTGWYYLFRLNLNSLVWEGILKGQIEDGACRYQVERNGTYAVSFVSMPVKGDSTWTPVRQVTPNAGGVLEIMNSNLMVPAGAVTDTMMMSFRLTYEMPENVPNPLERIYEFGPEGTSFASPVTLTVDLENAGYFSESDERLYLYYFDEQQNSWVRQDNEVELRNDAIVVELEHFSRYAFGR